MMRISAKLDLTKLKSVTQWQKGKTGPIECIIIPIDENNLYRGKNGIYLDLTGFEIRNPKEGQKDTHILKQSLPKEVYEVLTDEEKKALPILGNAFITDVQTSSAPPPLNVDDTLPY
jgi:hypothetical protein